MKLLLSLFLSFLLFSCTADLLPPPASTLVVEGWIENGKPPMVVLTRTVPVSEDKQSFDDLYAYLLRWAKVTVSDGEDSVVLTGRYDEDYFPPYVYTTGQLFGEVGKRYRLTVAYRDFYATAETTIPAPPREPYYTVQPSAENSNLLQVTARLDLSNSSASSSDNVWGKLTPSYYQFFTHSHPENRHFVAAFLGTVNGQGLGNSVEIPIYRGHQMKEVKYTPYFKPHEPLRVKCARMDSTAYAFWKAYMDSQALSGNLFFSTFLNLPTNIRGGVGYWIGYGSVTTPIPLN